LRKANVHIPEVRYTFIVSVDFHVLHGHSFGLIQRGSVRAIHNFGKNLIENQ